MTHYDISRASHVETDETRTVRVGGRGKRSSQTSIGRSYYAIQQSVHGTRTVSYVVGTMAHRTAPDEG